MIIPIIVPLSIRLGDAVTLAVLGILAFVCAVMAFYPLEAAAILFAGVVGIWLLVGQGTRSRRLLRALPFATLWTLALVLGVDPEQTLWLDYDLKIPFGLLFNPFTLAWLAAGGGEGAGMSALVYLSVALDYVYWLGLIYPLSAAFLHRRVLAAKEQVEGASHRRRWTLRALPTFLLVWAAAFGMLAFARIMV